MTRGMDLTNKHTRVTISSSEPLTQPEQDQLEKVFKDCDYRIEYIKSLSNKVDVENEYNITHINDLLNYTTLFKDRMLNYTMTLVSPNKYEVETKFHKEKITNLLNLILQELE